MPDKQGHLETGEWGERAAARMLKKKGYRILGRRVTVGTRDELDIVAQEGEVVVFIEVKTRRTEAFGRPASAVDRAKRHTLSRAAVRYLKAARCGPVSFRFDVVEVVGNPGTRTPVIRHIENAFTLDACYALPF